MVRIYQGMAGIEIAVGRDGTQILGRGCEYFESLIVNGRQEFSSNFKMDVELTTAHRKNLASYKNPPLWCSYKGKVASVLVVYL
jgi:hypothetical protein